MKKNSKKWTIGISLVLVIVIAASLGIGSIIGLTKKPDDFINIYIGDKLYDGKITIGDDSVSDETKALMVQAQFMSAALFGTTNIDLIEDQQDGNLEKYELLLEEGNDWKTTIQLNEEYNEGKNEKVITSLDILNNFVEIKFLNDTKNKSVISYLDTLKETSTNPDEILFFMEVFKKAVAVENENGNGNEIWLLEVDGITFMNIYGDKTLKEVGIESPYDEFDKDTMLSEMLFTILLNDYSYQVNVLTDMYTYSYLWQEPTENMYDSIFTKELVYYKPSITFSLSYDVEKYEQSLSPNNLIEEILKMAKSEVINSLGEEVESGWNNLYKDLKDRDLLIDPSTYDDYIKFDNNESFRGYQGVTFGTSAGEYLDSNWTDIENTWHFNKEEAGKAITEYTKYTEKYSVNENKPNWKTYSHENIMTKANYYVPEGANPNNNGAVITDVPDGGEYDDTAGADATVGSIYLYSQLYPYTFKQVKTGATGGNEAIMSYPTFSLFANDAKIENEKNGNIIKITESNWSGEGNIPDHYIFDDWFSYEHSLMGEIFISEAIINHDSSLTMNAQNYWKDKGFYIDLSGSYETDLLTFIPNVLIKDSK